MGSTERSRQNSSGAASTTSVRKDRRGRNSRCPVHWTVLEIPVATRSGQLEPVACSSRPDLAPRGAVRKVGPRPDQTRSACTDEPGEPASWPGDQSWGPSSPYRRVKQPSAADQEKNGGASSALNRSVCGTAVAAERLDGRPFFTSSDPAISQSGDLVQGLDPERADRQIARSPDGGAPAPCGPSLQSHVTSMRQLMPR